MEFVKMNLKLVEERFDEKVVEGFQKRERGIGTEIQVSMIQRGMRLQDRKQPQMLYAEEELTRNLKLQALRCH